MLKISRLCVLFGFIIFLTSLVFAQEDVGSEAAPEEGVALREEAGEGVLTGEVVSLDADLGTISVKIGDGLEEEFSVLDGETILWKGIEDIELSSINVADTVEVGYYTNEEGQLIASWVDVLVEEEMLLDEPEADSQE